MVTLPARTFPSHRKSETSITMLPRPTRRQAHGRTTLQTRTPIAPAKPNREASKLDLPGHVPAPDLPMGNRT